MFELPNPIFDLLADIVTPAFKQPDVTSDVALDDRLLQLEEPQLPLDPLFECTQSRKRHGNHARRNAVLLEHSLPKD